MEKIYPINEQDLRDMIKTIGKSATTACIMSILSDVILKSIVTPNPTKIIVDNNVATQLFAISPKDKNTEIFISSKKYGANWKPALFFGTVAAGCYIWFDYREKHFANVSDR